MSENIPDWMRSQADRGAPPPPKPAYGEPPQEPATFSPADAHEAEHPVADPAGHAYPAPSGYAPQSYAPQPGYGQQAYAQPYPQPRRGMPWWAWLLIALGAVIPLLGILAAVAAVSYNSFTANASMSAHKAAAAQVSKILQSHAAQTGQALEAGTELPASVLDDISSALPDSKTVLYGVTETGVLTTDGVVLDFGDGNGCAIQFAPTPTVANTVECGSL